MKYTDEQKREHTRQFQRFLRTIHQYTGDIPNVDANGVFSEQMGEIIAIYQEKRGLPITGQGDRETWHTAYEEQQQLIELFEAATALQVFPNLNFTLRTGSTGGIIYILQALLNALTPHFDNLTPVPYSGTLDEATAAQIRLLQSTAAYPETGEVDKRTWNLLALLFNSYAARQPTCYPG